jgi:hypothetical protein
LEQHALVRRATPDRRSIHNALLAQDRGRNREKWIMHSQEQRAADIRSPTQKMTASVGVADLRLTTSLPHLSRPRVPIRSLYVLKRELKCVEAGIEGKKPHQVKGFHWAFQEAKPLGP